MNWHVDPNQYAPKVPATCTFCLDRTGSPMGRDPDDPVARCPECHGQKVVERGTSEPAPRPGTTED